MKSSIKAPLILSLTGLMLAACHHQVKFDDISYTIGSPKLNATLVAVITPNTLNQTVPIVSFMTGAAHTWEAQPGLMLKDVVDVEFPQMFLHYKVVPSYEEPEAGAKGMTLELSISQYTFADFRATVTMRVVAYGRRKEVIFDRQYSEQGFSQGAKMFWGGAFAMKSAIRQSSLDAYKKVFAALRADLEKAQ